MFRVFIPSLLLLLLLDFHAIALEDDKLINDGGILMLSLKNYTKDNEYNSTIFQLYNNASITIFITDVPSIINFVVLQVHSMQHSLTLQDSMAATTTSTINGTNIGLVKFTNGASRIAFYLNNIHNIKVSTLAAVVGYTQESPVPGGCAMESPTKIAPYLDINFSDTIISVTAGPSSNSAECDPKSNLDYTFYQIFLPEKDFTEETYFEYILNMMTYSGTLNHSTPVSGSVLSSPLSRQFSSYPGIGRVFTAVVKSPDGGISTYVPTFTYSCNNDDVPDKCVLTTSPYTTTINVAVLLLGFFICFYGQKYFLINMFIMGSLAAAIVSYVILVKTISEQIEFIMVASSFGIVFGVIWVLLWWRCRLPLLSVTAPILNLCCLLTAIIFNFIRDEISSLDSDTNYWVVFFSIIIVSYFLFLTRLSDSNITASSVIGAHMFSIPIALSCGSSFAYVVINVIRRATVPGFNTANTEIPYQVPDMVIWLSTYLLIMIGAWKQMNYIRKNANRHPFPPMPANLRSDERTSLIAGAEYPNYS